MTSDQPPESQPLESHPLESFVVDLETVADTISTALHDHPGIVRLEPTLGSTMHRWKIASASRLNGSLRRPSPAPTVATRDGLVLSMADDVVNLHIDLATDIAKPALGLAREVQDVAAAVIKTSGLFVGHINVTILAIEGSGAS